MYSKIPMPRFEWASEDMAYHLCFFPWVGAVIGALELLWRSLSVRLEFGQLLFLTVAVAIPLIVTGGFHMDGFMDTCDAVSSYQDREKKLEILKDPHIGAFAVIHMVIYLLLVLGFGSAIEMRQAVIAVAGSFFVSRTLSGLSVIWFKGAKKDGSLFTLADTAARNVVTTVLAIQLAIVSAAIILCSGWCGVWVLLAMAAVFGWYFLMSRRIFGGITGDIAGYFVCVAELAAVAAAGIYNIAAV